MMNIRQKSVNVDRVKLLATLKENLAKHRIEYAEALTDFKTRLLADLKAAHKLVAKSEAKDLKDFRMNIKFPSNHEQDYLDVIEMLEESTDAVINLDADSFKAYYKNVWHWTEDFSLSNSMYKSGSFLAT